MWLRLLNLIIKRLIANDNKGYNRLETGVIRISQTEKLQQVALNVRLRFVA